MERIQRFDNKLYLEFGGKLIFDYHAARVLPHYDPNVKMQLLQKIKDKIGLTIVSMAVAVGELPRSEKKTPRVFDNRY